MEIESIEESCVRRQYRSAILSAKQQRPVIGHFDNEIDMAGLGKIDGIKKVNIKPQVDRVCAADGGERELWLLCVVFVGFLLLLSEKLDALSSNVCSAVGFASVELFLLRTSDEIISKH